MINKFIRLMEIGLRPIVDRFFPNPPLVMGWQCRYCGKEYTNMSMADFLFSICECQSK